MDRAYQDSSRYKKAGIILVLCLCAWSSLSAAIVMETPQTEVIVSVIDRIEERKSTPSTSLMLPLCSISITAKHHGRGYLEITHTSLISGFEEIPYQLFCNTSNQLLPDVIPYVCNPFLPLTIPITKLSVMLSRPLQQDRPSYTSEVFVHLKLEA